jgi:carbamoyltransferase
MNILGIGGYSHDSAAALVCDGKLVAAVAEERLTRNKHQGGIPHEAIRYCLETAGLQPGDIDHVGAYMRPGKRVAKRLGYRLKQVPAHPLYASAYMGYELLHNTQYMHGMRSVGGAKTQLHYMEHHPAHVASSFLVSPFDHAALLSIDYIGEWTSTWAGEGRGTDITCLHEVHYPHSLGVFYSAITDYLGFLRASDEYKVMGLASYGDPVYIDEFRSIVKEDSEQWYAMDLSWMAYHYAPGSREGYFSSKFIDRFGPLRKKDEPVEKRHENIAASAQLLLEETVLRIAKDLHDRTGSPNLCLAGGVALNCAMNGRLLRESPFENIYIQPAAGDDGIAIGAAYQLHHQFTGQPRDFVMRDARLGPEFDGASVEAALRDAEVAYTVAEDVETETAQYLADGNIVGWYQDRMEFGPRSLGARSILADPTRKDMQDRLNALVKHREPFRPFAPSCLVEKAGEYFEGCVDSPFMLFVYPVKPDKQVQLPAITHVDGTARVQTVSRDTNPRYYGLIEAFEKLRGVPVVVNTSFNVMGEPIVNTPEDAVRCFLGTGIDVLVMGNHIATKEADRV